MAVAVAVSLFVFLTLIFVLFGKWRQRYWSRQGVPQMEPNVVFGDTLPLFSGTSIKKFYLDIYRKNKVKGVKYVGLYTGWMPELMPLDLEVIKQIIIKDYTYFSGHGIFHHKNDPLTMHLFNLEGEAWKDRRTKLSPIFTTGKMKMMFDIVETISKGITDSIEKDVAAQRPVDIKDTFARFGVDVIGSVAFGLECDTLHNPSHPLKEVGIKVFVPVFWKFILQLFFSPEVLTRLGFTTLSPDIISYFTNVVKDAVNYREKNGIERKDFMQLMINLKNYGVIDKELIDKKTSNFATEEEIINEAFLFFAAGFETSSSTINFTCFELAQNLEIQTKLRKEILEVLERNNGKLDYEAVFGMEYLDKVVRETLRKYPVVVILPRNCTKDYKLPGTDAVIKKGTKVTIPVIGVHMDPEYYPNPEKYDPENFSPERRAARPEMAWMPFGEGPRQCIGMRFGLMQTKIGIITLLKDFEITLDKSLKLPLEENNATLIYGYKQSIMVNAVKI